MPLGVAGWVAVGTAALGAYSAHKSASAQSDANQAQIDANKQDPRIQSMLFGNGGDQGYYDQDTGRWVPPTPGSTGLLARYQGMLDTPQNAGIRDFGLANDKYLSDNGVGTMSDMHQTANNLMGGNVTAPRVQAYYSPYQSGMQAAQVNAPSQNGLDLKGAYDRFINGNPAENPYLTGAIQGGIDQSNNAFGNMLQGATRSLTENVLPSIRSGARVSGSYGGNREALAEGNAINDFSTQMGQAAGQFGQHNTDAAVGAQAGAFSQGQDRSLSAMTGLGAQQYGVAQQNAQLAQDAAKTNYEGGMQNDQFNAGLQQQNANAYLNSMLSTNALNTQRQTTGLQANQGLLSGAYGTAGNQDAYGITRAGQVNGLLQPYLSKNPVPTTLQPVYNNSAGGLLGGAMGGLALYNGLKQAGAAGGGATAGNYNYSNNPYVG